MARIRSAAQAVVHGSAGVHDLMDDATASEPLKATFNILFVCTGNTCRSPLAEALARAELERRNWNHVRVLSAGAAAHMGDPASELAVAVAERHGIPLRGHLSRPLTPELVAWADLVLGMSPSHLMTIDFLGGEHKSSLLGDFAAGGDGEGYPVPDPYGGDAELYQQTLEELDRLIRASLDRLEPILHP